MIHVMFLFAMPMFIWYFMGFLVQKGNLFVLCFGLFFIVFVLGNFMKEVYLLLGKGAGSYVAGAALIVPLLLGYATPLLDDHLKHRKRKS